MRRLALSLLPLGLVLVAFEGCYGATEIQVRIQTDVPCATVRQNGIAVRATGASSALPDATVLASSATCIDGAAGQLNDVGTLVFVPTMDTPQVSIRVVLGVARPTETCDGRTSDGCITADRRITYEKHRTLRLPIRLDDACTGRVCGDDQTCSAGACVTSAASCSGTSCGSVEEEDAAAPPIETPPLPTDAGIDVTLPVPLDGGTPTADAGRASCEPPGCVACRGAEVCCIEKGKGIRCEATVTACHENGVEATQVCSGNACACTDGQTCATAPDCSASGGSYRICGGSCAPLQ